MDTRNDMNMKMENKRLLDNKGSALIGALFAILMLGYFGATVAEMGASDTTASSNQMDGTSALYIGQAGLEYAKDQLYNGNSPDIADKEFSDGSFNITSDPVTGAVTVVSNRGNGERTQMITTDFSHDKVALGTGNVAVSGDSLTGLELVKSGEGSAIVDKITINWTWETCVESEEGDDTAAACDTDSDGDVDYDDFADPDHAGKIQICHVAANGNENTLSIAESGWEGGHDGHEGDYLGPCGSGGAVCELGTVYADEGEGDSSCVDASQESATVEVITLEGSTIYNGDASIGTPLFGAGDDVEIDVTDTILSTDGTYTFDAIQFNTTLPTAGTYEITITFADGSEITSTFVLP